jgi:uncharacterized protein (TIGR02246 family)
MSINRHIKSVIELANMMWNQAFNSGNYKEVAALYTEKGVLSPCNGNKLVGRSEIENLFKSFVDCGVNGHALEIIDVGGSDRLIYQVSRWSASGAETDGKKV